MDKKQARVIFVSAAVINCLKDPGKLSGKTAILSAIKNQIDLIKKMAIEISQTDPDTAQAIDILLGELIGATNSVFLTAQTSCAIDKVTEYHADAINRVCNSLQGLTQLHDDTPPSRGKALLTRDQAVLLYAHAAAIYSVRQVNQLRGNQANLSIIREAFSNMVTLVGEIENRPLAGAIETILFGIADAANTMQTDIAYTDIANCAERITEGCQNLMELAKLSQPHDTAD